MDSQLALGLFAMYVVVVSLWRLMSGRGQPPAAEAGMVWEKRRWQLPFFLVNVATPLAVGVVFICQGAAGLDGGPVRHYDAVPQQHVYQQVAAAMELRRQARIDAAELWAAAERLETGTLAWTSLYQVP